ncbi:MAG: hypothetical protein ACOY3P_03575 [Planctomycetota bacterium]
MIEHLTFRLTGQEQLLRVFRELPPAVQRRVLRPTVTKSARPIAKQARLNARQLATPERRAERRRRGGGKHLYQTIITKVRTYTQRGSVTASIGPSYPAGVHGHLVELGHRQARGGTLRMPKTSRRNKRDRNPRTGMGRVIGHVRGKPFLKPAWDRTVHQAAGLIRVHIGSGIVREAQRYAARQAAKGL